ncbi:MAG: DUF4878 domain-containing protein [Muribaculaceae bacterium]|nr:DUF4878 domain-containing protein [Muribaculaceae bacterium]
MKHFSLISTLTLVCFYVLSACSGSVVTDVDKHFRNAKQAVEALYNELPSGELKYLKEAVKFKENDKFTDQQKNEFFNQIKKKNFKVVAKKAHVRDNYTEVVCDVTFPDGTTKQKKFHVIKEDNVWKTEIGFNEMQEMIYK